MAVFGEKDGATLPMQKLHREESYDIIKENVKRGNRA